MCFLDPQDRLLAPEQHHPAVLALHLVDVGKRLLHGALIVSIDHPVGRHVAAPVRLYCCHPANLTTMASRPESAPRFARGGVNPTHPVWAMPAPGWRWLP